MGGDGVFFMRRGRPYGGALGFALIVLGILILLAMVLPSGFWWFLFGMALICGGCWMCRR